MAFKNIPPIHTGYKHDLRLKIKSEYSVINEPLKELTVVIISAINRPRKSCAVKSLSWAYSSSMEACGLQMSHVKPEIKLRKHYYGIGYDPIKIEYTGYNI